MEYVELDCRVSPGGDNTEILIAYLASIGYSTFEETDYGVRAYIEKGLFSQRNLDELPFLNDPGKVKIEYTVLAMENKNWNEEWEKNFQPVKIGNEIYVRAEYHEPNPKARYELIIQPRMAFGTGHHATTSLVMETMLSIDFTNKHVLDMGCGTGILAILASKMGAVAVSAIDNDPNAVENTSVNCAINKVGNVSALLGEAKTAGKEVFDVILANINRNIILSDMSLYVRNLRENGFLITSGYYFDDLPLIQEKAAALDLVFKDHFDKDNWCCAVFVKNMRK